MEENKRYESFKDLMRRIHEAESISEARQEEIDRKKQALREEVRIVVVEEGKEEIARLEAEKAEFDEMTQRALRNADKERFEVKRELQEMYNSKLMEIFKKQKELQKRLESFKTRSTDPDKIKQAEALVNKNLRKLMAEKAEFERYYSEGIRDLDEFDKYIGEPPKGEGEPPKGEGEPPKGEGEPPKGEGEPPKGEGEPPKCEGEPPKGEGEPPKGEGEPPKGEGEPPKGEGEPPKGEGEPPKGEGEPPKGEGEPPKGEGEPPKGEGEPPKGEGEPPKDEGEPPKGEGEPPKGEGEPPKGEGEPPKGEGEPPKGEGEPPKGEGEPPKGEGEPPKGEKPDPAKLGVAVKGLKGVLLSIVRWIRNHSKEGSPVAKWCDSMDEKISSSIKALPVGVNTAELADRAKAEAAREEKKLEKEQAKRLKKDRAWIKSRMRNPKGDKQFDKLTYFYYTQVDDELEANNEVMKEKDIKEEVATRIHAKILSGAQERGIDCKDKAGNDRPIKDIYSDLLEKLKAERMEKAKTAEKEKEDKKPEGERTEGEDSEGKKPEPPKGEKKSEAAEEIARQFDKDWIADKMEHIDDDKLFTELGAHVFNAVKAENIARTEKWSNEEFKEQCVSRIEAEILRGAEKQGIPVQFRNETRRPLQDIYAELAQKRELQRKTDEVSRRAAEGKGPDGEAKPREEGTR